MTERYVPTFSAPDEASDEDDLYSYDMPSIEDDDDDLYAHEIPQLDDEDDDLDPDEQPPSGEEMDEVFRKAGAEYGPAEAEESTYSDGKPLGEMILDNPVVAGMADAFNVQKAMARNADWIAPMLGEGEADPLAVLAEIREVQEADPIKYAGGQALAETAVTAPMPGFGGSMAKRALQSGLEGAVSGYAESGDLGHAAESGALSAGLGAGLEALGGQAVKGARWARNAVRGAEKIAPSGVAPSPGVFLDPAKVGGGIKRRAKDALYSLVDPGDAPAVSGDLPEESMGRWMGFESRADIEDTMGRLPSPAEEAAEMERRIAESATRRADELTRLRDMGADTLDATPAIATAAPGSRPVSGTADTAVGDSVLGMPAPEVPTLQSAVDDELAQLAESIEIEPPWQMSKVGGVTIGSPGEVGSLLAERGVRDLPRAATGAGVRSVMPDVEPYGGLLPALEYDIDMETGEVTEVPPSTPDAANPSSRSSAIGDTMRKGASSLLPQLERAGETTLAERVRSIVLGEVSDPVEIAQVNLQLNTVPGLNWSWRNPMRQDPETR